MKNKGVAILVALTIPYLVGVAMGAAICFTFLVLTRPEMFVCH